MFVLRSKQHGQTLVIALILLVLLTLFAFASFNLGKSNTQLVSNEQFREEAIASADSALEEVLSHTYFSDTPRMPFGTTNSKSYDVNNDGLPEVSVLVGDPTNPTQDPPPCIKSFQILPVDPSDTTAVGCATGVEQNFGIAGGAVWGQQCADVIWEVTSVASDIKTEASATVVLGIRVRQDANAAIVTANYCN